MLTWIRHLDRLLRGDVTRPETLRTGSFEIPVAGLSLVGILLGVLYGVCMGLFAVTGSGSGAKMQILASAVKIPALCVLTLLVSFPSLYVFNALVGSRLTPAAVLRLLIAAIAILLAVLASLGPIVAFFSVTTTSYPFMKLLNVAVFAVAGLLGMRFLLQTLRGLTGQPPAPTMPPPIPEAPPADPAVPLTPEARAELARQELLALRRSPPDDTPAANVRAVFRIWILVFALVGAQMSWILRPFLGDPNQPFSWFRPRQSNFFQAVWQAIYHLFN